MFISKQGDGYSATYSTDIYYTTDKEIIIELKNLFKNESVYVPFDVIMWILGAQTDKEIIDYILINIHNEKLWQYMKQMICDSLNASYSWTEFAIPWQSRDVNKCLEILCGMFYRDYSVENKDIYISEFMTKIIDGMLLIQLNDYDESSWNKLKNITIGMFI